MAVVADRPRVVTAPDGREVAYAVWGDPQGCDWLAANVPGCEVQVDDAAGHLGGDPVEALREETRWLRDGIAPT